MDCLITIRRRRVDKETLLFYQILDDIQVSLAGGQVKSVLLDIQNQGITVDMLILHEIFDDIDMPIFGGAMEWGPAINFGNI